MSFVKEFKEFAMKGNVMDLAIGVIIGGAFGKIVDSVVSDLIMPLIGIFGNADFSNMFIGLNPKVLEAMSANPSLGLEEARKIGPVFAYGSFLTVVANFMILAFVIFLLVKGINRMKRNEEAAAPPPAPPAISNEEKLLTEIRDLLKSK